MSTSCIDNKLNTESFMRDTISHSHCNLNRPSIEFIKRKANSLYKKDDSSYKATIGTKHI